MTGTKVTAQQSNFVLLASTIYLIVSIFGFIGFNATSSSAIQLNSYYNAIAALVGFVSYFILKNFHKESEKFTFGLERFIPLLTLVEGLLIFSVSQNACASSTQLIFSGGSTKPVDSGTLIYSAIITMFYVFSYVLHLNHVKNVGKSLPLSKVLLFRSLSIAIFSATISILFIISLALSQSNILPLAVNYVEPIAIFVLVSIAMKGPMGQIFGSMNQLLLGAPQKEESQAIRNIVASKMTSIDPDVYKVRPTKQGEMLYVNILLSQNFADSYPEQLKSLPTIKSVISKELLEQFPINKVEFSL